MASRTSIISEGELDLVASRVWSELSPSVPGAGLSSRSNSAVVMMISFGGTLPERSEGCRP
ncbi:hypothetical protein ASC64_07015 [Nocardioides sp. Root122]|nr:hypothetical protein ASC64_07015 [Nocardioides sp. Root122]